MKIVEVLGFYLDQGLERTTPSAGLMQRVAAAFTPSGKVKGHWDVQGGGVNPTGELHHVSPIADQNELSVMAPIAVQLWMLA
jgi:hypothetical protein